MILKGRGALVTGASRGIGRAIALAYAKEGANVAITARSLEPLQSLKREIESVGVQCSLCIVDLSSPGSAERLVRHFEKEFPPVEILVNNAAIGSAINPKPVSDFDDEYWQLTIQLNLTTPYQLCKKFLPGMIKRGFGRIINIASLAGKFGLVHGAAYSASKHGLLGLTRTIAAETVKQGITANAICPGPVHTRANDERMAYDASRLGQRVEELIAAATPMGRRLEPEEISPLAVYLASNDSSAVTGQAFNIDGGIMMV